MRTHWLSADAWSVRLRLAGEHLRRGVYCRSRREPRVIAAVAMLLERHDCWGGR